MPAQRPCPNSGGAWWAASPARKMCAGAPPVGDTPAERVDRLAIGLELSDGQDAAADPLDGGRRDDLLRVVVGHEHELHAHAGSGESEPERRTCVASELDHVGVVAGSVCELAVDDEPLLVLTELLALDAERLPDARPRAVGCDRPASPDELLTAPVVGGRDLDAALDVLNLRDRDTASELDSGRAVDDRADERLDVGLVEADVVVPRLVAESIGRGVDEYLIGLVDDLDVLHRDRDGRELLGDAEALQGPHRLAVEVDRTRGGPHLPVLLEADRDQPGLAEQRERGRSDRATSDDDDIDVGSHKHSFVCNTFRIECYATVRIGAIHSVRQSVIKKR